MSLFIENISLQFSFLYVFIQDGHQDNPDLTKGVWKHSLLIHFRGRLWEVLSPTAQVCGRIQP